MIPDLQIAIPCGQNSELFANFLISTIKKTISKKISYEFLIGINKPNVSKKNIVLGHSSSSFIFVEELTQEILSRGHAHCLNLMLKNMTSKYGIFLDSDVAMLKKCWDIDLLNELNKNVIMIGSEYHPSDGKIINRPNVITCAFDVAAFKKLNIDFYPSLRKIITTSLTKDFYGTEVGQEILLDTGCEIMEKIIASGYSTKTLKIVSSRYPDTASNLKVLSIDQRGEEYHLFNNPISTHIGRSLSRNFSTDPVVNLWKNSVESWLHGKI